MTDYVVGFAFSGYGAANNFVLLLRKRFPEWQSGKVNGIGGKLELGETFLDAMIREWTEETGDTATRVWDPFLILKSGEHNIAFYRTRVPMELQFHLRDTKNDVGEVIVSWPMSEVHQASSLIPNLKWILPLAAYQHDMYEPMLIEERVPTTVPL